MVAAATIKPVPVDKFAVAKDMFFNQPDGFPYEGFNPDQVVLPPGDDCGVVSDDDDIGEEDIQNEETGFGTSIALDGLPKVGEDKFDKLVGVLKKRFEPHGEIREGGFWMPTGDDGITKGYAFIEYSRREEAIKAAKEMDQHKLDKLHLIRCYRVDDLDRLQHIPEEYTQPEKMTFDEEKSAGAMTWLMDRRGRDQFVIQHDRQHKVCWNDPKKACAELFHQRSAPTEWSPLPLIWSPQGTYICSLHPPLGAALWCSNASGQFERVMKFPCPDVTKADFSANEEYITLYSVVHRRGVKVPDMLISVFDVQSGRKLRTLQENLEALLVGAMRVNQQELLVPFLMWSNAKPAYAARLAANAVYVYNGADMTLLDKKPIAVEGAHDARWSPSENMLAVYQEEHTNLPARVAIYALPSKQEIRAKSLFMVHEVHMYWHAQSKYLAVHVAKHTKSKKTTFATIELFTIKSKTDVINDVLELPNKGDKVLQIAWEPKGDRFAVIHGDMSPGNKYSVSFFTMLDKTMKQGAKLLGTITGRNVSELHWSPAGRNIILAGISSTQGALEFFNVDDMSPLRSQQHFMCNNVKWDQTGRYACSWVDAHRDMDHGYIIWSFTGELLYRESLENFWNFAWRPRPPSLLPPEKDRELAKNLRPYAKRYEEEDELLMAAAGSEQLQRRQQLRVSWEAWAASKEEWRQRQLEHFTQVLGYVPQELPSTMTEKVIEQVIDVKEEPYTASS